jgi:hypothetical protein
MMASTVVLDEDGFEADGRGRLSRRSRSLRAAQPA